MLFGRNLTSINPFQGLRIRLFPLGFSTKSDRDDEFYENSDFVVLLTVLDEFCPLCSLSVFPDFVVLPMVFRRNSVSNYYLVACEFVCFPLVLRRNASPAVHLLTSSTRLFSIGFRTKSNPDRSFLEFIESGSEFESGTSQILIFRMILSMILCLDVVLSSILSLNSICPTSQLCDFVL